MTEDLIDRARLDDLMELGEALYTVFDRFEEDLSERLDRLRSATENTDGAQLREVFHTLKGASMTVGASALADRCRAAEGLLASGDLAFVDDKYLETFETMARTSLKLLRDAVRSGLATR